MKLGKVFKTFTAFLIISCLMALSMLPVTSFAQAGSPQVNLAFNKPVQVISPDTQFDALQGIANAGSPIAEIKKVTDEVYADYSSWSAPSWFKFYRNLKRELIVDLEEISTVKSLSISFGQNSQSGIIPPDYVKYYVSNNGSDYAYVGKALPDIPLYVETVKSASDACEKKYTLDEIEGTPMNIQARYVKLVFIVDVWAFADTIKIMGYPGIVDGAVIPKNQPDPENPEVNKLPAKGSEEAAKISDQFLFYTGAYATPEITNWTKEKVMPVLGYQDITGNIKDWFFDDLLVLPVTAVITPSGTGKFVTKKDMTSYLDFIFKNDTQLGAINAAAKEINGKLNTNKKVRINMAIPMIEESPNFGDIKGDGSTLSLKASDFASMVSDPASVEGKIQMAEMAINNKKAAFKWYIDEVEKRFKAAGYDQLELNSYYWFHEKVVRGMGEEEVIKATSDYLHSINRYFTWIPYIGPSSPYTWRELGFDAATLQHNYAFKAYKKNLIPETVGLAEKVGASVEIEYDNFATLSKYLNYGISSGYMADTFHVYYYGATPLTDGAYAYNPVDQLKTADASSAMKRSVYDRTYEFLKGTYKPTYTINQTANISDKANIVATSKLMLADNIIEGSFEVLYDNSKVEYKGFSNGLQLPENKAAVTVDASTPGVVKVSFKVNDPKDALYAEVTAYGAYASGAPELVNLNFKKKDKVDDSEITPRLFVLAKEGTMKDKDGNTYYNWDQSDIIPGTLEDKVAKASAAVKNAENNYMQGFIELAKSNMAAAAPLIKDLPESSLKASLLSRLEAISEKMNQEYPVKIEKISPEASFAAGSDAKITIRATNNKSNLPKDVTMVVALYNQNNQLVNFVSVKQTIDANKSADITGMIKLPASGQYEIRCLVWDTIESMAPMSNTIKIPVN